MDSQLHTVTFAEVLLGYIQPTVGYPRQKIKKAWLPGGIWTRDLFLMEYYALPLAQTSLSLGQSFFFSEESELTTFLWKGLARPLSNRHCSWVKSKIGHLQGSSGCVEEACSLTEHAVPCTIPSVDWIFFSDFSLSTDFQLQFLWHLTRTSGLSPLAMSIFSCTPC